MLFCEKNFANEYKIKKPVKLIALDNFVVYGITIIVCPKAEVMSTNMYT